MEYRETKNEAGMELMFEGMIDTNASNEFQTVMVRAIQKSNSVAVNMEQVNYISSAAVRAILVAVKTSKAQGCSIAFRNLCPTVHEVLEMSGLLGIMTIE